MNRARPGRLFLLATVSLATLAPGTLLAQEGTGVRGTLSVTQGLEFSDNRRLEATSAGDTLTSVTRLGFGVLSETRTERFTFNLNGIFEDSSGDGASEDEGFRTTNRSASLGYRREGANARLEFGASFSNREIQDDFIGFFVDGEFDPRALKLEGGEVDRTSYSARLQTGLEGPFGFDVRLRTSDRTYEDTTDPDLVDQSRLSVDTVSSFRLRPNFSLRALAGVGSVEEEGVFLEENERSYLGFGIETETARGLTLRGDILFDETETLLDGETTDEEDGVGFDVSVEQARPNGSVGLAVSSRIDGAGRRTSASVSRGIELPTGGLSLSLGIVDQEDGDLGLTSSLRYLRETPVGTITADLAQQPSTQIDEAFLNTSISLGINRDLNELSQVGATLRYGSTSVLSDGEEDSDTRTTLGLTYDRELTQDWGLTAGVEYTRIDEADEADRSSSTVFFNIGRDFDFGF